MLKIDCCLLSVCILLTRANHYRNQSISPAISLIHISLILMSMKMRFDSQWILSQVKLLHWTWIQKWEKQWLRRAKKITQNAYFKFCRINESVCIITVNEELVKNGTNDANKLRAPNEILIWLRNEQGWNSLQRKWYQWHSFLTSPLTFWWIYSFCIQFDATVTLLNKTHASLLNSLYSIDFMST